MNDEEFEKLQNAYFEEVNRRNEITKLNAKGEKLVAALSDLQNTNNLYENVGNISFKIYGSSDGHGSYVLSAHNIEISNETAIDILRKEIDKLNKQLLKLKGAE